MVFYLPTLFLIYFIFLFLDLHIAIMNKQSDWFESHTAAVLGLLSPLDENNLWLSKRVIVKLLRFKN